MSAFLCSSTHISTIIHAARVGREHGMGMKLDAYVLAPLVGPDDPRRTMDYALRHELAAFDLLLAENIKSLDYRYPHDTGAGEQWRDASGHAYDDSSDVPDVVSAIKACHCYRYQACEDPDYDDSKAAKLVDAIIDHLAHWLPGYEQAPWHIEDAPRKARRTA